MAGCRNVYIHHESISHLSGLVQSRTKEKGKKEKEIVLV
jgi:hypothetical protein